MAKPLVSDELWAVVAPQLPPPRRDKLKSGRPRLPDRAALAGILFVLKTGIPWEYLPRRWAAAPGSWRRLRDWQQAGVWHRLHTTLLDRLGEADQIDWSWASIDTASVPAKRGGATTTAAAEEIGPNPTDRGKPGTKRHVVVDRAGIPLAVWLSAANVHDGTLLTALVDAIEPIHRPQGQAGRPRRRPDKLHADKAYSSRANRRALRVRGITPRIARPGIESSDRLGRHRWVVERTLAWLGRYRRLTIRYERRADIHLAFLDLSCVLICFNTLQHLGFC